ncbi:MAG: DnaJ domain-containing protein [Spirochaetia bacterium]|nr:DnaJ domain-containing protein [Spirochaetia bacterium]
MNPRDYTVAAHCERCKTLFESEVNPCPRCGASAVRPFLDFYALFELSSGFSESSLKAAYKKLSLKYHPDLNPEGKDMFLLVSQGFQTLKDPATRSHYDEAWRRAIQKDFDSTHGEWRREGADNSGDWDEAYARQQASQFEEMFRDFHRFRQGGPSLVRASKIAGNLGLMLGALVGVFFGVVGAIPGAVIGYAFGRSNPGLAPIFLSLAQLILFVGTIGVAFVALVFLKNFPALLITLFVSWLLFGLLRSWSRELFTPPPEDSPS